MRRCNGGGSDGPCLLACLSLAATRLFSTVTPLLSTGTRLFWTVTPLLSTVSLFWTVTPLLSTVTRLFWTVTYLFLFWAGTRLFSSTARLFGQWPACCQRPAWFRQWLECSGSGFGPMQQWRLRGGTHVHRVSGREGLCLLRLAIHKGCHRTEGKHIAEISPGAR